MLNPHTGQAKRGDASVADDEPDQAGGGLVHAVGQARDDPQSDPEPAPDAADQRLQDAATAVQSSAGNER